MSESAAPTAVNIKFFPTPEATAVKTVGEILTTAPSYSAPTATPARTPTTSPQNGPLSCVEQRVEGVG